MAWFNLFCDVSVAGVASIYKSFVQSGCIRQQSRSRFRQPKSVESVEDEKKSVLMQLINSLQNKMVV